MNGYQQRNGYAQPQNPAAKCKQRPIHMVKNEDLIAQHCEAIQVFGALVMFDGGHRRL